MPAKGNAHASAKDHTQFELVLSPNPGGIGIKLGFSFKRPGTLVEFSYHGLPGSSWSS